MSATAAFKLRTKCLPAVPAVVKVEVATFQTSAAKVPKEERVRVVAFQTLVGIEVAREVEALSTAALVLALTTEAIEEEAVLVFVLTIATTDEEAVVIVVVKPEVCVLVFALTTEAIEEEAVSIVVVKVEVAVLM